VTTRKARKGARGTPRVVSSSPKAGTRRAQGSRVALTLARPRR
jgi:beta-lactam-binding protein with PASTA domain